MKAHGGTLVQISALGAGAAFDALVSVIEYFGADFYQFGV